MVDLNQKDHFYYAVKEINYKDTITFVQQRCTYIGMNRVIFNTPLKIVYIC